MGNSKLYLIQYNFLKDKKMVKKILNFKLSDNYLQNHSLEALKTVKFRNIGVEMKEARLGH